MRNRRIEIVSLAFLIGLSGCGYHVSGHGDLMPKTMKERVRRAACQ